MSASEKWPIGKKECRLTQWKIKFTQRRVAVHRQFRSPLLREKNQLRLHRVALMHNPLKFPQKLLSHRRIIPTPGKMKTHRCLQKLRTLPWFLQIQWQATPSIRLHAILSCKQPRPHRIQMNIIEYRPISISRLHHDRLVSSSKKMPPQPVPRIDPPRVGILKPPHARREIRLRRFQKQMVVITHQCIRMNPKPRPIANLSQRSRFELVLA